MELTRDICDTSKSSPEAARTFGIVLVRRLKLQKAWLSREIGGRLGTRKLMLREHYQATTGQYACRPRTLRAVVSTDCVNKRYR